MSGSLNPVAGLRVLMVVEQASATGWRYYRGLFRHLAQAGVEVQLVNLARSDDFVARVVPWVTRERQLGLRGGYPRAILALRRTVGRWRPDVVHGQEYIPAGYASLALTSRSAPPPMVYGRHHSFPLSGLPRLLDGIALRGAQAISVPSEWARGWLRREHPESRGKAWCIPHGMELPEEVGEDDRDSAVLETARAVAEPTAVILARLREDRGHDTALQAWSLLARDGVDVRLVCVGEGPARDDLLAEVGRLGLGDRVSFPGSTQAVRRVLAGADLLVAPSRVESFGLAAVEGMAAGLPVVASRAGALQETVQDGHTGFLVPPGDAAAMAAAVRRLVENEGLRHTMGEAGRARHEAHYTPAAMGERHLELYRRVAGGGR